MVTSNLGAYKTMVELAKAADGPVRLGLYIAASGILVGGVVGTAAGPAIRKGAYKMVVVAKLKMRPTKNVAPRIYTINTDTDGSDNLRLHAHDRFCVLSQIDDGTLIEILGNKKNPWMVSTALLATVSDFSADGR